MKTWLVDLTIMIVGYPLFIMIVWLFWFVSQLDISYLKGFILMSAHIWSYFCFDTFRKMESQEMLENA